MAIPNLQAIDEDELAELRRICPPDATNLLDVACRVAVNPTPDELRFLREFQPSGLVDKKRRGELREQFEETDPGVALLATMSCNLSIAWHLGERDAKPRRAFLQLASETEMEEAAFSSAFTEKELRELRAWLNLLWYEPKARRLARRLVTRTLLAPTVGEDLEKGYTREEDARWVQMLCAVGSLQDQRPIVEALRFALNEPDDLPPQWMDSKGRVDISTLLARMVELSRRSSESNVAILGSTDSFQNGKIEHDNTTYPWTLSEADRESPAAWLEALERQELEEAFRQIRNPTDPEAMAMAMATVRWKLASFVSTQCKGDRVVLNQKWAIGQIEELERTAIETLKSIVLPDLEIQDVSDEVWEQAEARREILVQVQATLNRIEGQLTKALGEVNEILGEGAEDSTYEVRGVRELRGGLKLLKEVRASEKTYIVRRSRAPFESALLLPATKDSSFDAETTTRELNMNGSELIGRACAGERILVRGGQKREALAVLVPLDRAARAHLARRA